MIHIQNRLHTCTFQVGCVFQCLSEKRFSIADKGVAWRKTGIVSLPGCCRIIFDFAFHYSKIRHSTGQVNDIPFMLVCEEAHNYIPKNGGAEYAASKHSIERIAKEGRKYGLNLMVVSQRPSEVSETIFSQCNNFIVLKLTNINDQNCIKNLLPDNNASLVEVLPTLATGECLVVGDAVPLPAVVKMEMPNPVPNSSNVNVYDEWNKDWIDIVFDDVIRRWRRE